MMVVGCVRLLSTRELLVARVKSYLDYPTMILVSPRSLATNSRIETQERTEYSVPKGNGGGSEWHTP